METLGVSFETASYEQTLALGGFLAGCLQAGDFVALTGSLGAGKTSLTQGLAQDLGYGGAVTSPTFTLLHLYEGGRLPLYHFDAYRLLSPGELEGLGYEEYFYGDGICVMEWSDLVVAYLPERRIQVTLERVADEARRIIVAPLGGDESWRTGFMERMRTYVGTGN